LFVSVATFTSKIFLHIQQKALLTLDIKVRGAWAMAIGLWSVAFFAAFLSKWPGRMISPEEDSKSGTDDGQHKVAMPSTL